MSPLYELVSDIAEIMNIDFKFITIGENYHEYEFENPEGMDGILRIL